MYYGTCVCVCVRVNDSTMAGGKSMLYYTQSCIILFEDSVKCVYCKL